MRMLKPSPGECADRQTILQLKIKAGGAGSEPENVKKVTESGVLERQDGTEFPVSRDVIVGTSKINIQPFVDENEALQRYLEQNWFPDLKAAQGIEYDDLLDQLGDVNERLWKLEDEARMLKRTSPKTQPIHMRAAEVLFHITEENDKRAELVSKINALFKVDTREKIYA